MPEQQQSVAGPPNQLNLFPAPTDIPDDVQDALNVVTGAAGGIDQFIQSQEQEEGKEPLSRLHPDFKGSKYEMLKKGDRVAKQMHYEDPQVKTLDISDPAQADEMAKVLALVGDPGNGIGYAESPPQTMLDPNAPRGFRTIVVIRWWKMRTIVTPTVPEAATSPQPKA